MYTLPTHTMHSHRDTVEDWVVDLLRCQQHGAESRTFTIQFKNTFQILLRCQQHAADSMNIQLLPLHIRHLQYLSVHNTPDVSIADNMKTSIFSGPEDHRDTATSQYADIISSDSINMGPSDISFLRCHETHIILQNRSEGTFNSPIDEVCP